MGIVSTLIRKKKRIFITSIVYYSFITMGMTRIKDKYDFEGDDSTNKQNDIYERDVIQHECLLCLPFISLRGCEKNHYSFITVLIASLQYHSSNPKHNTVLYILLQRKPLLFSFISVFIPQMSLITKSVFLMILINVVKLSNTLSLQTQGMDRAG